jgi:hypothetical protein
VSVPIETTHVVVMNGVEQKVFGSSILARTYNNPLLTPLSLLEPASESI